MAGRKLSAKAEEEVVFMENLLLQCDHLLRKAEEYAAAKKGQDDISQQVVRQLQQIRQQAMMKNLGPIADQAGGLSVQCSRGSQTMRARTMREGITGFKVMLERVIKATIEADQRQRHEEELKQAAAREAEKAAAQRMAQRALRESQQVAAPGHVGAGPGHGGTGSPQQGGAAEPRQAPAGAPVQPPASPGQGAGGRPQTPPAQPPASEVKP